MRNRRDMILAAVPIPLGIAVIIGALRLRRVPLHPEGRASFPF